MRDHMLFNINGKTHRVGGGAAFVTLANYLRQDVGATGTKIVCEEGDCGACTVLFGRVRDGGIDYQAVNSCIQSLIQLDGTSIVTVEGLKLDGALAPVQESMVICQGAQCGYCTPGFVVAMAALFERCDRLEERQVRDGLTGNLCRCTGYEPIIKAALAVDGSSSPKIRDRYPSAPDDGQSVLIETGERSFFAPTSLDEAIRFKAAHPRCTIVQGGTDVGVWINKRAYSAPAMLSLSKIRELDTIGSGARLSIGANVTLTQFEETIADRIPELAAILNIFGSPQIKNAGTLVGNVANGSPIGDTLPYLLIAEAELEIAGASGRRTIPIASFYRGYKQFDLQTDEIITRIIVPVVTSGDSQIVRLYKVSRRKDLDISAITAAIRLRMKGDDIEETRIVYGGVAPTVVRLPKTEEFLTGKTATLDLFERAGRIARDEVKPISDVRGSAAYRSQLAENLMMKFWYDAFGEPVMQRSEIRDQRSGHSPGVGV